MGMRSNLAGWNTLYSNPLTRPIVRRLLFTIFLAQTVGFVVGFVTAVLLLWLV